MFLHYWAFEVKLSHQTSYLKASASAYLTRLPEQGLGHGGQSLHIYTSLVLTP